MRKRIGGKVQDTSTAKEVASISFGAPNDLDYVCETLYRSKSGAYFIHGTGGARSKYAKHVADNSWTGGEDIFPLTYEAAAEWAEKNLSADEYTAAFGEPAESEEDVSLSAYISARTKNKIDRIKSATGKTCREIIEEAIDKL